MTTEATTKRCTMCGKEKVLDAFYRNASGRHGRTARCGECLKGLQKTSFRRHRRDAQLRQKYGITLEQYEEMFRRQGGSCAICRQPERVSHGATGTGYSLAVDHCHDTGNVRGLLCSDCNIGLGRFKDDTDFMKAAIEYVEVHRGGQ